MADYDDRDTALELATDGADDALVERLRRARALLHELSQAVALVAGTVELMPFQPADSPERGVLERELALAAQLLVQRTERLQLTLQGDERSCQASTAKG